MGGRLDHTLANLSTLHMFRHLNIALVGEGNLVRLVRAGRALIRPWGQGEGPHCGLIPLNGPAVASSTGACFHCLCEVVVGCHGVFLVVGKGMCVGSSGA